MNLKTIMTGLSKLAGRSGLLLKKHSPEILLIMGIGSGIASTILACRATLKFEEVIDNHKEKLEKYHGEISAVDYPEKDQKKELVVIYAQTTVEFIKLYGPAVSLGVASLVCILSSHGIMKQRTVALMAAYNTLEEGFKAYRKRVVEEFGEEKDYMFKNGLRKESVVEAVYDEDGKEIDRVREEKLAVIDPNKPSEYSRFFDETADQWTKSAEYNFMFLHAQQKYWNKMLVARGHVFLNEVYDALGMRRSVAGNVVGWVLSGNGDNEIDFGIFEGDSPRVRAFVNGYERSILLDFNVDGIIYNKI